MTNALKPISEKKLQRAEANAKDTSQMPVCRIYDTYTTKAEAETKKIPYGEIIIICIVTIMALFVTYLSVRINEINTEISSLNSSLAEIREKTAEAKAELADKKDITEIRKAAEALGMVRAETLPSHYVSVESEDEIVLFEDSSEDEEISFLSLMSALRDSINSFIEYLR